MPLNADFMHYVLVSVLTQWYIPYVKTACVSVPYAIVKMT